MTERRACRLANQPRGTQRYRAIRREDEDALTQAIVQLASQYGRYGYRRITALLKRAGWRVGKDRGVLTGPRNIRAHAALNNIPLPGSPHPKRVIQPLSVVSLILAKTSAVKQPSTPPAISPWKTSVAMERGCG
jgi:transposase InsO family protein